MYTGNVRLARRIRFSFLERSKTCLAGTRSAWLKKKKNTARNNVFRVRSACSVCDSVFVFIFCFASSSVCNRSCSHVLAPFLVLVLISGPSSGPGSCFGSGSLDPHPLVSVMLTQVTVETVEGHSVAVALGPVRDLFDADGHLRGVMRAPHQDGEECHCSRLELRAHTGTTAPKKRSM